MLIVLESRNDIVESIVVNCGHIYIYICMSSCFCAVKLMPRQLWSHVPLFVFPVYRMLHPCCSGPRRPVTSPLPSTSSPADREFYAIAVRVREERRGSVRLRVGNKPIEGGMRGCFCLCVFNAIFSFRLQTPW